MRDLPLLSSHLLGAKLPSLACRGGDAISREEQNSTPGKDSRQTAGSGAIFALCWPALASAWCMYGLQQYQDGAFHCLSSWWAGATIVLFVGLCDVPRVRQTGGDSGGRPRRANSNVLRLRWWWRCQRRRQRRRRRRSGRRGYRFRLHRGRNRTPKAAALPGIFTGNSIGRSGTTGNTTTSTTMALKPPRALERRRRHRPHCRPHPVFDLVFTIFLVVATAAAAPFGG